MFTQVLPLREGEKYLVEFVGRGGSPPKEWPRIRLGDSVEDGVPFGTILHNSRRGMDYIACGPYPQLDPTPYPEGALAIVAAAIPTATQQDGTLTFCGWRAIPLMRRWDDGHIITHEDIDGLANRSIPADDIQRALADCDGRSVGLLCYWFR